MGYSRVSIVRGYLGEGAYQLVHLTDLTLELPFPAGR
jgi:hypothetical protein